MSRRRIAVLAAAACCLASGVAFALVSQEYVDATGTKSWVAFVAGYLNVSNQAVAVSAANPLPITGTITASGGATAANQATEITSLASIATNTAAGATAANQTTANTSLATIATNTATGQRVQAGATKVVSVQFTRPSNGSTYGAGQAICASTSVDCTGLIFAGAGRIAGGGGLVQGIQLIKNSTGTTNASFTVEVYQAAPSITGIKDASTYSPTFADVTSGAFRSSATCTSATVNGDNAFFQCTLANPNATMAYVSDGSAQIYAMIQANAAYVGVSGEKFQVNLALLQD